MLMQRTAWVGGCLVLLLTLAGCGGEPSLGEVTGTVTYNGKEVEDGSISFEAKDGKGDGGGIIKNGKYTARKVPVGLARVKIVNAKEYARKKLYDAPDSPTRALTRNDLPEKFNTKTELEFDVKPGPNEKNWDLKD